MIIITAANVYFYQVKLTPQYNFLYVLLKNNPNAICEDKIKDKLFILKHTKNGFSRNQKHSALCEKTDLYLYNFSTNTSSKISIDQAKKIILSDNPKSPDGFIVLPYCSSGNITSFSWWNTYTNNICLQKNDYQKHLPIHISSAYGNNQFFAFIGWTRTGNIDKHPSLKDESK